MLINKQRTRHTLAVMAAATLMLTGCGAFSEDLPNGELTYYNDSDRVILFVEGPTVEEALSPLRTPYPATNSPGTYGLLSFDAVDAQGKRPADDEPWCVAGTYWVLGAKDDPMDRDFLNSPPHDLDNIEILEQLGPGHCWPEQFTEYHYTG